MLCLILYILLIRDSRWWFQQTLCWRDDEGYSPRKIIKIKNPGRLKESFTLNSDMEDQKHHPYPSCAQLGAVKPSGISASAGARARLSPYDPGGPKQRGRFVQTPGRERQTSRSCARDIFLVVGICQTKLLRIVKVMLDDENEMGDSSRSVRQISRNSSKRKESKNNST